jgi:hypothetical protein
MKYLESRVINGMPWLIDTVVGQENGSKIYICVVYHTDGLLVLATGKSKKSFKAAELNARRAANQRIRELGLK